MDLVAKWNDDQKGLNENLLKFVKLYKMASDFENRESHGSKPYEPVLKKILILTSLKDLEDNYQDLVFDSISLPFHFHVMQDFKNSNNQVFYFGAAKLFLPDTSYYQNEERKQQLIGLFTHTTTQLMSLYGYQPEEINQLLSEALKFDSLLVPVTKSSVEAADYVKMYYPLSAIEIKEKINNFDLIGKAESAVEQSVDKLIATNLDFINAFDEIINEENFKFIKSWMIVSNLISFSSHLTDAIRVAGGAFTRALSGIKEARSKEKDAFYYAYNSFSQVVGLYYGETYFGPKAKEDVRHMVHEMVDVYKERIKDNTWLED